MFPKTSAVCEIWKSIAVPRSNWLPNNCRKAFAHFGQVYLMWLFVVKNCPFFWARLLYVAEDCINKNENRKNFISQPNLLLLQIESQAWTDVWFNLQPTNNDVYWRNFFIFCLLFRSFLKCTYHIFVCKTAFVLHYIKIFPKPTRCILLIGWAWEDLLSCTNTRARV